MTAEIIQFPRDWAPTVQWKRRWSDEWQTIDHLTPLSACDATPPSISTCRLLWSYGRICRPGETSYQNVKPSAGGLLGAYVRLLSDTQIVDSDGTASRVEMWCGRISNRADEIGSADASSTSTGDLILTAFGLDRELHTAAVDGSYILRDGKAVKIGRSLPFNLRSRDAAENRGNRSKDKVDGAYIFDDSADAKLWTARDVCEYLLKHFSPEELPFTLQGGDTQPAGLANLDQIVDCWPAPNTVAGGISAVVRRQRGHIWRVAEGTTVIVEPVLDQPVTAANLKLAANPNIADLAVDGDDADRQTAAVEVRESIDHRYDRIDVVGKHIWVCGSLDDTLEKAWDSQLATDYDNASQTDQTSPKYEDLYQTFKVDTRDNEKPFGTGDLLGAPACHDDGEIDFNTTSPLFAVGRKLTRNTPLRTGYTYHTEEGAVKKYASKSLLTMKLYVQYDGGYYDLSRIGKDIKGANNCSLSPLAGDCGVRIHASYPHYLAKGSYDDSDPNEKWPAALDYHTAIATVAMRCDEKLRVTVYTDRARNDGARNLVIPVENADCWVVRRGTVVGVENRQLLRTKKDMVLRNDKNILAAVAAVAKVWYARPRKAVTVKFDDIRFDTLPGQIISRLAAGGRNLSVNTVVTKITWDFTPENCGTTIETDFAELDTVALAGGKNRGATGIDIADDAIDNPAPVAPQQHQPANLAPNTPIADLQMSGLPGQVRQIHQVGDEFAEYYDYDKLTIPYTA